MTLEDVAVLACPLCCAALVWSGRTREGELAEGCLHCSRCATPWPVADGLPHLFLEREVVGTDRLMRAIYNGLPALHDPLTLMLTPLLQGRTETELRQGYLHRLELDTLVPRPGGGSPPRILEVGMGAGANLPLLARALPPGLEVEIWGVDLSGGMIRECRRRLAREGHRKVRLVMADAHTLPFSDHFFDRVFEIGGLNGYREPRRALAEMARVARPGTPLVVVDEQLDAKAHSLKDRLTFRLLTFYTKDAHCPRELLPEGAEGIIEEQISRFYFCLTFRMPVEKTVPH